MRNILVSLYWAVALGVSLAISQAMGAEADGSAFRLYPVPGVFVSSADAAASKVAKEFDQALDRKKAIEAFTTEFRKQFPNAVATIDDQNRFHTFAVSLHVLRASKYKVEKPDNTVDVYLPVTVSLYVTNPLTGEVIFRNTQTEYNIFNQPKGTDDPKKTAELYLSGFNSLLKGAIADAKEKFKPFAIDAHIKTDWKGYSILDRGLDSGIAKGDTVVDAKGNQLSVIHAGNKYAVALPLLGKAQSDLVYTKFSNQSIQDLKKPRALVLNLGSPADFSGDVVTQFFSDDLGNKASFSIVPINREFAAVQKAFTQNTKLSQSVIRARELPDFFVRLKLLDPVYYDKPSNKDYIKYQTYHTVGFAELLDSSGRVHYTAIANEKIDDEVVHSVAFEKTARREIVMKNALIELATEFSTNVKFQKFVIAVSGVKNNDIMLADTAGALSLGAAPTIYHKVGAVDGIDEEVLVPTWSVSVVGVRDGVAIANKILETKAGAPSPAEGDLVVFESIPHDTIVKDQSYGLCDAPENLGTEKFAEFADFVQAVTAKHSTGPFYADAKLEQQVRAHVNAGNNFKQASNIHVAKPKFCLAPVYNLTPAAEVSCPEKEQFCTKDVKLMTGFTLKAGGKDVEQFGVENTYHVPLTKEQTQEFIRSELFDRTPELLGELMKQVTTKKLQ